MFITLPQVQTLSLLRVFLWLNIEQVVRMRVLHGIMTLGSLNFYLLTQMVISLHGIQIII